MEQTIRLPLPTNMLVVMCGPAGAGKSSFAAEHFKPTEIVASDVCRELLCDSAKNQKVTRDAFELFHFIIQKRLQLGRRTVADSTALRAFARARLLEMAQQAGFHAYLLVFNVAFDICRQRVQQRERSVPIDVISEQCELLQYAKQDIQSELWDHIYELGADVAGVRVLRQKRSIPSH